MMKAPFTRADYMQAPSMETHRRFFAQLVTPEVKAAVLRSINRSEIIASRDEHLNDIALARWDSLEWIMRDLCARRIRELGDHWSLGNAVCIAKEAARQIQEEGAARPVCPHPSTNPPFNPTGAPIMMTDYRIEFPGTELGVEIPPGFTDSSAGINACPSFSHPLPNGARVEVYVFPEHWGGKRFTVATFDGRGDCKSSHHSDDWANILDWFAAMLEVGTEHPLPAVDDRGPFIRCFLRRSDGQCDVFVHRKQPPLTTSPTDTELQDAVTAGTIMFLQGKPLEEAERWVERHVKIGTRDAEAIRESVARRRQRETPIEVETMFQRAAAGTLDECQAADLEGYLYREWQKFHGSR